MNAARQNTPEQPLANRKSHDRAFILPLVGLLLLLPPFAQIFQLEILIFGIPFTMLYLLVVWALLIGCAANLSGRLRSSSQLETKPNPPNITER